MLRTAGGLLSTPLAEVEITRLATEIVRLETRRRRAAARLNALLARPIDDCDQRLSRADHGFLYPRRCRAAVDPRRHCDAVSDAVERRLVHRRDPPAAFTSRSPSESRSNSRNSAVTSCEVQTKACGNSSLTMYRAAASCAVSRKLYRKQTALSSTGSPPCSRGWQPATGDGARRKPPD